MSRQLPTGWVEVSPYCIRTDDGSATICKVFVTGWVYELWIGKNLIAAGMSTARDAIRLHGSITAIPQEAGAKSSPSQAGAQAAQLSFIEAS